MLTAPVTGSTFSCDQRITDQSLRADATAAPRRPPISAWLEELGIPKYQVRTFQMMPASIAQKIVQMVTKWVSTIPAPMVFATAVPQSAPTKFRMAAMSTAWRAVRTLVETTVAMALAAS